MKKELLWEFLSDLNNIKNGLSNIDVEIEYYKETLIELGVCPICGDRRIATNR